MSILEQTTRAERVFLAQLSYFLGETQPQIARRLGLGTSTVGEYLSDPDGSKHRALLRSYARPCPRCGKPMHGGYGKKRAPGTCRDCHRPPHREPKWTRERLIEIMQVFEQDVGRPPATADFSPGLHPHSLGYWRRQKRKERLGLPPATVVFRRFGSWNAGLVAAGFKARVGHGTRENMREYQLKP